MYKKISPVNKGHSLSKMGKTYKQDIKRPAVPRRNGCTAVSFVFNIPQALCKKEGAQHNTFLCLTNKSYFIIFGELT